MSGSVASFPKIVEVERIDDNGPDSGASCPHCGAPCRYVTWFRTESGALHGAARVCFSLFPKSKYAARTARILTKDRNGHKLASWDQKVIDAIRQLATLGESEVDRIIREQDNAKRAWVNARYGGRRPTG